ncbi:hypothetical protein EDD15DRAFT_368626 [Pisolithus albus]|nr:hypothetical protein EDD15DRAFT_368626 [Pisolithus albus]
MRHLLDDPHHARHLMEHSRAINNLFTFAGIGVTGSFQQFSSGGSDGPPSVAITGRTYHLLRNTEYADHSIHWFLYDESLRSQKAVQFGAHSFVVQAIADDLRAINPYVGHLHHFRAVSRSHQRMLELQDFTSNSDFAAVLHASNSTTINPRSILIRRHGHQQPHFLNILSHHYESLHYVLFFPHGDIGWGATPVPGVPQLSQIDWYRSRLLANDDNRFLALGRLCSGNVTFEPKKCSNRNCTAAKTRMMKSRCNGPGTKIRPAYIFLHYDLQPGLA